jgi:hypothetical protein
MKNRKNINLDDLNPDFGQGGALLFPRKFYNLLLLAGENGQKAQYTLFNLRYPISRSTNTRIRRQLIDLLINLINICTTDMIIYNKLRSLAMSRKLPLLKEDVNNTNDKVFKILSYLIKRIDEEFQGTAGTQLSSAAAAMDKGTTTGIDAFSPVLTKKIVRRFPVSKVVKQIRKRRKKG